MRKVQEIIQARPTSDGDGVKLLRVFGGHGPERFDPFLMLDEFGSEQASDYIGGFPPHPHRGFETITYMLQGKMEHRDHMENVGLLEDGDVQWMTAGSGIIHSEMPKQTEGKMRGFQLWLNLAQGQKMTPPKYEDVAAAQIPWIQVGEVHVKAVAGEALLNDQSVKGYFTRANTKPVLLDVRPAGTDPVTLEVPNEANVMLYVYEGAVGVEEVEVSGQQLARLSGSGAISIGIKALGTQFLLIAGTPLKEPIAQYGPFVMNTPEQIEQAIQDYQNGTLAQVAKAE